MKKAIFPTAILLASFFALLILSSCKEKKAATDLVSEFQRLKIDTAIIYNSQGIEIAPLWSPDSKFVAINLGSKWYKFSLTNITLKKTDLRDRDIGVSSEKESFILKENEEAEFRAATKSDPETLATSSGDKIELTSEGQSTSFIITKNGESPKKIWSSQIEHCHDLSLSPSEEFVAYVCEMNGLFVMKIK